jgi:tRNA(Ile)-lysidine synthase
LEISYKRESKRINLPNDFLFEKSCKSIRFYPKSLIAGYEYVKKPTEKVVILSNLGKIITFDKSLEKCRLIIRNRHKGDRLGSKKLKDLFIDKHIDLFLRDTAVVVEKDGQIVFAEGVVDNDNVYIRNNTEEA